MLIVHNMYNDWERGCERHHSHGIWAIALPTLQADWGYIMTEKEGFGSGRSLLLNRVTSMNHRIIVKIQKYPENLLPHEVPVQPQFHRIKDNKR